MAELESIVSEKIKTEKFDIESVRRDFPILGIRVHGKPLAYLDNAATSQKPQIVIDAIKKYYEEENANVHRSIHLKRTGNAKV